MDELPPKELLPELPQPTEHERREWCKQFGRDPNGGFRKHVNINTVDPVFYNELDTRRRICTERPHHRRMLELALQGFKIMEISRLTGFTHGCVRIVLDQPWAKKFIVDRMREETENDFAKLLKDEVLPSIEAVIEVRDSALTRPETKLSAANSIIDRVLGRAAQPILTGKVEVKKLSDAELDTIIARESSSREETASSN